jgi:hypothetical protein
VGAVTASGGCRRGARLQGEAAMPEMPDMPEGDRTLNSSANDPSAECPFSNGMSTPMQLLYHSDSFVVVRFDVPAEMPGGLERGGYEIVDKFARKEIFLEGLLAESFKAGVEQLAEQEPSVEEFDAYISRFTALAQQPVAMH